MHQDCLLAIDIPALLTELRDLLSSPIDGASLAVFRLLYGAIFFVHYIIGWEFEVLRYTNTSYNFHYELTPFIVPLKKRGMNLLLGIQILAAFSLAIGFLSPYSAFILFLTSAYKLLMDKSLYTNHAYLHVLICLLLSVVDAGKVMSMDSYLWGSGEQGFEISFWQVLIFKLQILIVYFYGGMSKLNYDWLFRAMPLRNLFADKSYYFLQRNIGRFIKGESSQYTARVFSFFIIPYFAAWSGMFIDLFVIWFMLFEETLYYALAIYLCFTVLNHKFFEIGTFPYMNYAFVVLFLSQVYSRSVVGLFFGDTQGGSGADLFMSDFEFFFFIVYLAIQLVIPMRRFVKTYIIRLGKSDIHADNAWYFSWNMMHAVKHGKVSFDVYDLSTKRSLSLEGVSHEQIVLGTKQEHCLRTRPRCAIQYVKFLEGILRRNAYKNFGIRVNSQIDINCSGMKMKINPRANLCKEEVKAYGSYWWHLDD
ncbi:MAG: hypothetical protein ACI9S8_001154 [Chlamydiales bacterium]|jgi:hypothetical protein